MKKLTLILAVIIAAYTTPTAFAQSDSDNGFYVGGGGGIGKISDDCNSGDSAVIDSATVVINSCDDKSTVWRVFGGYQFNPYLGAEIEYAISNGYETGTTVSRGGSSTNVDIETDFHTFGISAVARYPFSDSFSVFARGGFHRWEQEASGSGASASENGTDPLLGGGIEFRPTDRFGVRLEHARYFGDEFDLDATALQLVLYL